MKKNIFWITAGMLLCSGQINAQQRQMTIEELFEYIDTHNKEIKAGELFVQEADAELDISKSDLLPSLQVGADFSYIGDGVMTDRDFKNAVHADMPHWGNSFVLKAAQTIYAGGAIRNNIERSKLQKNQAEQLLLETKQNIRFLLLGHYLDLFQLANQKTVYERNLEQTRLLVKDMRAAYRQGTALKSDITRYELQLQNVELRLTNVVNRMNILNHKLVTSIGMDTAVVIEPDTAALMKLTAQKGIEQEWINLAMNAPQMQLAESKVALAKNTEKQLRSELRPHIELKAAYDLNGPILVEVPPLDHNFMNWNAGIGLSYNLDALYKTRKKLNKSRVAILHSQEEKHLVEEELLHDIHSAYINLDEAYVRLRTQRKSVQLAHENYYIVKQRYLNGQALITDMLDASNTQLDMELQLTNAQISILYQYYLLQKITGIL